MYLRTIKRGETEPFPVERMGPAKIVADVAMETVPNGSLSSHGKPICVHLPADSVDTKKKMVYRDGG